jgi:hypothetical protein
MELNGQPIWTKNENGQFISYVIPGFPVPTNKSPILKKHNIIKQFEGTGEEWVCDYIDKVIKNKLNNDTSNLATHSFVCTAGTSTAAGVICETIGVGAAIGGPAMYAITGIIAAGTAALVVGTGVLQKISDKKEYNELFSVTKEYVQAIKFNENSLGKIVYKKKEEEFIYTATAFFNGIRSVERLKFFLLIINYVSMIIDAFNVPPVILYLSNESWPDYMKDTSLYSSRIKEELFDRFDSQAAATFGKIYEYAEKNETEEDTTPPPPAPLPPEIKRYSTGIHFYEENMPSQEVQNKLEIIDNIYAQIMLSDNTSLNTKRKLDNFYIPNVQKIIDGYKHYRIFSPKQSADNAVPMTDARYKKMVEESVDILYKIITDIGAQDDEWYISDAQADLDVLKQMAVQDGLIDSQNVGAPSIKNFKNVLKKDAEKSV